MGPAGKGQASFLLVSVCFLLFGMGSYIPIELAAKLLMGSISVYDIIFTLHAGHLLMSVDVEKCFFS